MDDTTPGTGRKALAINLDRVSYGSFAEIGGAAGTVAKTISALLEIGRIEPIRYYDERYLSIRKPEVLARIEAGDEACETLVPPAVVDTIKTRQLFGYQAAPAARQEHPRPSS